MFNCPCCGLETLPNRDEYEICSVCGWEDDSTKDGEYSDCNRATMQNYKLKHEWLPNNTKMQLLQNVKFVESHEYYDGPLTGFCEYQGEKCYFYWDIIDDNRNDFYVVVEVPKDFIGVPDDWNKSVEEFFKDYSKKGYCTSFLYEQGDYK